MGMFAKHEKKLGFGLMRLPLLDKNDDGSVDLEQFCRMVDLFLERGYTYFDTAWMYCGFRSEEAVRHALTSRYPRERYSLATKLHVGFAETREDCDRILQQQLEKTGVDYFDYYLLHNVAGARYDKYVKLDCFRWLEEKKQQGLMRHVGISYHDNAAMLDRILTAHPEIEFVQLQLNYLDWEDPVIESRKCYETAVRHGKPVIVMEPIKGGTLARLPETAEALLRRARPERPVPLWALDFAAALEHTAIVLSGMSTLQQVEENTACMAEPAPIGEEERALLAEAAEIIRGKVAVPCTGCAYCMTNCPKNIPIAPYFSLYNAEQLEDGSKAFTTQWLYYWQMPEHFGKAGDCIGCGGCERACPQKLPVMEHLRAVAAHFEKVVPGR